MADVAFDFKKFIDETKATILTPADYFSVMAKTGGFAEPLIKAVIYGLVAALINLLWMTLSLGAVGGAFGGMLGGGVGVMGLVMSVVGSIIALFVGGAIVLVISAICGGSTEYEANVRVTASIMAISPISALFGFLSGFNLWLGGLASIAVSLYGLWLLYNALIKALGGKEGPAKVISIILAIIPVLMIVSGLLCMKAVSTIPDQMMKNIPTEDQEQMKKALEEATKGLEQMNKELQEEGKEAQK
ncbi:MAG TPA: Yip1 family protein [Spirochaetota bacterium]|nr:Yip1 family protein [Spirochaetota bacterium]HPS87391.1 Yip1 family protein [Spirochaetota bacterium]